MMQEQIELKKPKLKKQAVIKETKKDVSLDFDLESCKFGSFDKQEVIELFQELGFNSLVGRLPAIII